MGITTKPTQRGFERGQFTDANGVSCSIQESSAAADEWLLWLGCNDIGLMKFTPYGSPSWQKVELQMDFDGIHHSANTRMHLTQSMVRELLPLLKHFADTGRLPDAQEMAKIEKARISQALGEY